MFYSSIFILLIKAYRSTYGQTKTIEVRIENPRGRGPQFEDIGGFLPNHQSKQNFTCSKIVCD